MLHTTARSRSTIVEIKERGLTFAHNTHNTQSTIVEIKERGLTCKILQRAKYTSTIVEIKERGLTLRECYSD